MVAIEPLAWIIHAHFRKKPQRFMLQSLIGLTTDDTDFTDIRAIRGFNCCTLGLKWRYHYRFMNGAS